MDTTTPPAAPQPPTRRRAYATKTLKVKADAKRTASERLADGLTNMFGTITFLVLNAVWFVVWMVINLGLIPGVAPFDPFPFGLLTMIVSLEAIFLAIIVLISQNRQARVAELREEIDLQINMIAEEEVTKLVHLLAQLLEKNGVNTKDDADLQRMLKPVDSAYLEHRLEDQLNAAKKIKLPNLMGPENKGR